MLLATAVFPEFRKQGIATELIRRVLDEARSQGKTVITMCPIVRTFIEHTRRPDRRKRPGVTKRCEGGRLIPVSDGSGPACSGPARSR